MATSGSSNDTRNFQCVTVASVDVIKLPLSDILASHIKPVDLYHKIKSCSTLKLRSDQQKICFIQPPGVPDYNKFDVTLLYTLIRNLCSLPRPTQGWGNEPKTTDSQISDDIERLRLFRNNYYAHAESAVISDAVFKDVWKELKLVFRRIQPKTGCSIDYEEELINIERTKFTDDHLTTFRVLLETFAKLEKQTDGRDEPDIFLHGENEILCGGTARFEADVKNVESSCWSITWQQHRGNVIKRIDTNIGRHSGSTKKTLVIKDVCKEDEGVYQATLSLETNGPEYKSRNTIRLHAIGDAPHVKISVDSPVCFGSNTTIKSVISSKPTHDKLKWQTSEDKINFHTIARWNLKENGKFSTCPFLEIRKATFNDKRCYRLLVWNRIGKGVSNTVYLDVTGSSPNITTSFESNIENQSVHVTLHGKVYFLVNSPAVFETFWTKNDERITTVERDQNINPPSLIIKNVSPDDAGEYRLTAINAVGSSTSDVIVLGVPCVFVEKIEDTRSRGKRVTMTIRSLPTPWFIQWSARKKDDDSFKPIDINAEEYNGTTVSFPHPLLVLSRRDQLEKYDFQIEVINCIGKTRHEITGNIYPVVPRPLEFEENTLYKDYGASLRFTKLNNILAKQFPPTKLEDLKFSLTTSKKIKNRESVSKAKTTQDCLRILQDENLFTQSDVIFMQFLCTETDCLDLYEKCIEYAEKQRALCYFERKSVNGYVDVQFHVRGEISGYTKEYIQEVIETVAAILDCKVEDILLNGVRHSTSFLLSLSVKEVYCWKFLALNEEDYLKLRRLNIDYLIIDEKTVDIQESKDSDSIEDSDYNLQDVVRCHLCDTPDPHVSCDSCETYLCKTCIEEHLLDESKKHITVPFKSRRRAIYIPKCTKHTSEYCKLFCVECDIPICVRCTSAEEHWDHECVDEGKKSEIKKSIIEKDLQELEKSIYPEYQKIASSFPVQKNDVCKNAMELTKIIDIHGEDLHRKVDNVIQKLKSDVDKMKSIFFSEVQNQEDEINRSISEITENIAEMKNLLDSNNVNLFSAYTSKISKFRRLPPKLEVDLPRFTPQQINEEQLYQQFGSFSRLSIKIQEHDHTRDSPNAESSTTNRTLIDKPLVITEINTGHGYGLNSVSSLKNEHIWTCSSTDNVMYLYNLQGEVVESIQTKSGNRPWNIAVTRNRNLVYTDYEDKTVNIVKNTQIQTVIRLRGWSPLGVCCTSAGDLLVVLVNNDLKQTKLVRYSGPSEKQTIKYTDKGRPLFSFGSLIKYISENSNLDICVADNGAGAVVVVNQFGKLRFNYTGPRPLFTTERSFDPVGITNDSKSRILIADQNNQRIHILDKNGQFLRYIDNCHLQRPRSLSVDTRDNLFVAEFSTNKVKKIQYCI